MTRAREHLILCGNVGRNRNFNWADNLFPLLGLLTAPPEPEIHTLSGGSAARIAPLAFEAQASAIPSSWSASTARRQAETRADRIAAAILNGDPLEPLL